MGYKRLAKMFNKRRIMETRMKCPCCGCELLVVTEVRYPEVYKDHLAAEENRDRAAERKALVNMTKEVMTGGAQLQEMEDTALGKWFLSTEVKENRAASQTLREEDIGTILDPPHPSHELVDITWTGSAVRRMQCCRCGTVQSCCGWNTLCTAETVKHYNERYGTERGEGPGRWNDPLTSPSDRSGT